MHPLYTTAMETTNALRDIRLQVSSLSMELSQAEYHLQVVRAKVERGLIKQARSEKALGPTVEDRTRVFTLALDADAEYQRQWKRCHDVGLKLEQARAESASLRDKLSVLLAAMQTAEGQTDTYGRGGETSGSVSRPAPPRRRG